MPTAERRASAVSRETLAIPPPGVRASSEDSMSESSPEPEKKPEEPVVPQAEKKLVPVEAVAESRKQTRAARAEADGLRKQLETLKQQDQSGSEDDLMDAISQTIDKRLEERIQKDVAPLKAELDQRKTAMTMGLNDKQAEVLFELKSKVPGLSNEDALVLARNKNPDLFPTPGLRTRPITPLPAGGDSPLRTAPSEPDYMAESRKARKEGDGGQMSEKATLSFMTKLNNARARKNG